MGDEIRRAEGDGDGERILEISGLRDEIEVLERRRNGTFNAGVVISGLFGVAGVFMEQSSTLWFLGVLWLLLTLRLVVINRNSGSELRLKEAALESLTGPSQDTALPPSP